MNFALSSQDRIRLRCRIRAFQKQDKASELLARGMLVQDIARELDVRSIMIRSMNSVATYRRAILQAIKQPDDFDVDLLTPPEKALVRALASVQFNNYERDRIRMPESREVSALANRAPSWAATTARRRVGMPEAPKKGREPRPAFKLVDVRGNGYMELTLKGWRACYALFPELFAWDIPADQLQTAA